MRQGSSWLSKGAPGMPTIIASSSIVTKVETTMIDELHQFLQTADPMTFKKAAFNVEATIEDVPAQQNWNYIYCSDCPTKLGKAETSLFCTNCEKTNNIDTTLFRFEVFVRDKTGDVATFVIFDTAAVNLLGRTAPDLLQNEDQAAGNPSSTTPSCFNSIVGTSWKFEIKIAKYNLTALKQTFTVNRISALESTKSEDESNNTPTTRADSHEDKRSGKKQRISG